MKIGFLLNHYAGHQLYHTVPIAFALSSAYPDVEVYIISSDEHQEEIAKQIGRKWKNQTCIFKQAQIPYIFKILDPVISQWIFWRKAAVLHFNKKLFCDLDALVVPEKNSLSLKKDKTMAHLKFIRIRHGAGDRATGLEISNDLFDLILASGSKMKSRLIQQCETIAKKIKVIGYPKFDAVTFGDKSMPLFQNEKPVVLYSPHYKSDEFSFQSMGKQVLDFFKEQTEYNLIFAPHILLYKRAKRHGTFDLSAYESCANIHIDTGSDASLDMTYTLQADIFLGDVSSQIYEFVYHPRPCIFINAHNISDWQDQEIYTHWRMGDVVQDITELKAALLNADENHRRYYKDLQEQLLSETFDLTSTPSSRRAADEIMIFLNPSIEKRT